MAEQQQAARSQEYSETGLSQQEDDYSDSSEYDGPEGKEQPCHKRGGTWAALLGLVIVAVVVVVVVCCCCCGSSGKEFSVTVKKITGDPIETTYFEADNKDDKLTEAGKKLKDDIEKKIEDKFGKKPTSFNLTKGSESIKAEKFKLELKDDHKKHYDDKEKQQMLADDVALCFFDPLGEPDNLQATVVINGVNFDANNKKASGEDQEDLTIEELTRRANALPDGQAKTDILAQIKKLKNGEDGVTNADIQAKIKAAGKPPVAADFTVTLKAGTEAKEVTCKSDDPAKAVQEAAKNFKDHELPADWKNNLKKGGVITLQIKSEQLAKLKKDVEDAKKKYEAKKEKKTLLAFKNALEKLLKAVKEADKTKHQEELNKLKCTLPDEKLRAAYDLKKGFEIFGFDKKEKVKCKDGTATGIVTCEKAGAVAKLSGCPKDPNAEPQSGGENNIIMDALEAIARKVRDALEAAKDDVTPVWKKWLTGFDKIVSGKLKKTRAAFTVQEFALITKKELESMEMPTRSDSKKYEARARKEHEFTLLRNEAIGIVVKKLNDKVKIIIQGPPATSLRTHLDTKENNKYKFPELRDIMRGSELPTVYFQQCPNSSFEDQSVFPSVTYGPATPVIVTGKKKLTLTATPTVNSGDKLQCKVRSDFNKDEYKNFRWKEPKKSIAGKELFVFRPLLTNDQLMYIDDDQTADSVHHKLLKAQTANQQQCKHANEFYDDVVDLNNIMTKRMQAGYKAAAICRPRKGNGDEKAYGEIEFIGCQPRLQRALNYYFPPISNADLTFNHIRVWKVPNVHRLNSTDDMLVTQANAARPLTWQVNIVTSGHNVFAVTPQADGRLKIEVSGVATPVVLHGLGSVGTLEMTRPNANTAEFFLMEVKGETKPASSNEKDWIKHDPKLTVTKLESDAPIPNNHKNYIYARGNYYTLSMVNNDATRTVPGGMAPATALSRRARIKMWKSLTRADLTGDFGPGDADIGKEEARCLKGYSLEDGQARMSLETLKEQLACHMPAAAGQTIQQNFLNATTTTDPQRATLRKRNLASLLMITNIFRHPKLGLPVGTGTDAHLDNIDVNSTVQALGVADFGISDDKKDGFNENEWKQLCKDIPHVKEFLSAVSDSSTVLRLSRPDSLRGAGLENIYLEDMGHAIDLVKKIKNLEL